MEILEEDQAERTDERQVVNQGSVLVVDDDDAARALLQDLLEICGYVVRSAGGGEEGVKLFSTQRPDVVITDVRMPGVDGLELLRQVRTIDELVPVILVTGHGDLDNAMRAVRRGAYDFILKPINPEILTNAVRKGIEHCRLKRFEKNYRRVLEDQVQARTRELARANEFLQLLQKSSIFALAKLAQSRDGETAFHLRRMQAYCRLLCIQLSLRPQFRDRMTPRFIEDLVQCSVLHDIGKVAIPDYILFNPSKFGVDEFEIMKQHAIHGGRALEEAALETGREESFLTLGRDVAYYHHEHWDGTGYPFGLKGEGIPLAARVVAIADVYDALTTQRRYKDAYSHDQAVAAIVSLRASQFDPELVDIFLEVEEDFRSIQEGCAEAESSESIHSG